MESDNTNGSGTNCIDAKMEEISVACGTEISKKDILKQCMLQRLAGTDAHFKHQQRGEPDLSDQEKINIAGTVLDQNAAVFLARFGKYLTLDDIEFFNDRAHEYEIKFYLDLIKKENSKVYSANRVKNRRYEAMKQLISEGEYFSEDTMKHRDPYLYYQLIGQHMTEEELAEKVDKSDLRFSTILLKHMDILEENIQFAIQKDKEEGQMEEEEEDESEDEAKDEMEEGAADMSESMRAELRQQFHTIMQERFLCGQDTQFNYNQVDENAEYDDLDILDKDEEEKYFDAEESDEESVPNITTLTGVLQLDNIQCKKLSTDMKISLDCQDSLQENCLPLPTSRTKLNRVENDISVSLGSNIENQSQLEHSETELRDPIMTQTDNEMSKFDK